MSLILKAASFAARAHEGQRRKQTGDPYVMHPARVAARAALLPEATEELVAAAFLHDVLEDTDVQEAEIGAQFGAKVLALVRELTAPTEMLYKSPEKEKPPRAERKRLDREHYAKVSREAKILKMLDRLDNLRESDPGLDFTSLYAYESLLLAEAVGDAHAGLKAELMNLASSIARR